MKNWTNIFLLIVLFFVSACTDSNDITAIQLHGYNKQSSIAAQKGKLILLSFGYTHCPDICPATLLHVGAALDKLNPHERAKLFSLFITLDPERDSIETLNEYTAYFHKDIFAAYLDKRDEKSFLKHFQVEYFKDSESDDYLINHTSYIFLIDDQGKILDMMGHQTDPAEIAKAIQSKLQLSEIK